MQKQKSFERQVWTDRFKAPMPAALRESLRADARSRFDDLRRRLLDIEGINESVVWYGDCWHWSLEYRTRRAAEPLAVIIPAPTDLQLALPLDREFTRTINTHRMKRSVRDGLDLVQEPYESRWGLWSITGAAIIDDLQDLIEMKLAHLAKRAG